MLSRTAALVAFLAVAFLVSCGSSASGIDTAEIQAFDASARGAAAATADYSVAASAMTSPAECASAQASYDARARPLVGRMQGMGASMDAMMDSMGHMDADDMGCTADAMRAELDRHAQVACASATDVAADRAEALGHVAAMNPWIAHADGRARDLGAMAGMQMGGMGGGSTTGHCRRAADGTYALQP